MNRILNALMFLSALALYALVFVICVFFIQGCAYKTQYERVNVPVKCDIDKPIKPNLDSNFLPENIKNLLIYTESLESALNHCVGGN